MKHWCLNESMSIILSMTLVNTHGLAHWAERAHLLYIRKQKDSFPGGVSFYCLVKVSPKWFPCWYCFCKLLSTWWSDTVISFLWCFKLLNIIININAFSWILIFFNCLQIIFNGISRFLMYIIIVSRQRSVSGLWVKFNINFLSSMLWHFGIETGTVRILVVMSGRFMFCLPSLITHPIVLAITE